MPAHRKLQDHAVCVMHKRSHKLKIQQLKSLSLSLICNSMFGDPGEQPDNLFMCSTISPHLLPACRIFSFMNADSCLLDVCDRVSDRKSVCCTSVNPPFWSHEAPAGFIDESLLPADAGSYKLVHTPVCLTATKRGPVCKNEVMLRYSQKQVGSTD